MVALTVSSDGKLYMRDTQDIIFCFFRARCQRLQSHEPFLQQESYSL